MRLTFFILLLTVTLCQSVLAQNKDLSLPNPKLTPGQAIDVAAIDLCKPGYKSPARTIPITMKTQVFERYHIPQSEAGYNVDHLIPARLGGSNAIENLWPQPLAGEWGRQKKNDLESRLFKMICRGQLDLKQAQQEIASDWISAYKKYVGAPR